jgi:DNA-binding response OmpR family regulator
MTEFKNQTVLVVDDSPADLKLTINVIKDHYKVLGAKGGEQALSIISKANIDIVLLDVNMPGIDGYETCKRIKILDNPPAVIFVSANDSTEEITKGYDVGGEDYLVKPYSTAILLNKVESTLKLAERIGSLVKSANQASSIAMTAMSSSGELGIVVNALRASFSISTLDDLGVLVIDAIEQYGLSCSVQLRTLPLTKNYSASVEVSPLEIELLNRIAGMQERFFDKGTRLFINQGNVSILIKNMPVDNEDFLGRIKDYLAIVIEGINEKCTVLGNELSVKADRNNTITKLVNEADISLTYVLDTQLNLNKENMLVLAKLEKSMQASFLNLGLSESQENELLNILDTAQQASAILFEKSTNVNHELKSFAAKFNELKG